MKQSSTLSLLICEVLQIVVASITGVTYMDHFDFEQRYRDVNECNPFHWHPLHLPQECVQMFENLIRSRIKTLEPYRVVQEIPIQQPVPMYPYNYIYSPIYKTKPYVEVFPAERKSKTQYEKLYELLKRDVQDLPSVPFLGESPYLGVIAMYKQPVSYKSVAMIKKLARAYDNSDIFTKMQPGIDKGTNQTEEEKANDAMAILKIKKFNSPFDGPF